MNLCRSICATAVAVLSLSASSAAQTPLTTTLVANGFDQPVFVVTPREDFTRLFVLELTGKIWIVENGAVLPTPFLDLSSTVQQAPFQGLFGLGFHPDYWNNGYFYVYYAGLNSNSVLERYQVSADPNVADPASGMVVLDVAQPLDGHEGGSVEFGPDGYLYLALGDGEPQNDVNCNGQNDQLLHSKMIRIDVDGGTPYAIPPDNPFVGDPNVLDEIWSSGLRHPWRFSFDRDTGDMYISDNGQELVEEIDFEPAGFAGGRNYGWPVLEGSMCFALNNCPTSVQPCGSPVFEPPLFEYDHSVGCSVIGGYVYRGCAIPDLQGTYFYGDFCGGSNSGSIFSFRYANGVISEAQDRTNELRPGALSIRKVCSFGEDGFGELYVIDHNDGELFKIIPATAPADCDQNGIGDDCELAYGLAPDCNQNGVPDRCDIGLGVSADCDADGVPDECQLTSSTYCLCASGSPCGNNDAGAGCANSTGVGATLTACGSGSVANDDLVMTASGLPTNESGIFFMGLGVVQLPFGNGLRCVGPGGVGLKRYAVMNSGAAGEAMLGPGIAALSVMRFDPPGHIGAGQTWNFQYWYRDPADPCGGAFNVSNAIGITFQP